MASNATLTIPKNNNASLQTSASPISQIGPLNSGEGHTQRRSGGSGSFGAGQSTRTGGTTTRNKKGLKSQHKGSRRYRLADEDAIAESAAMNRSINSRRGQTSITHLMNFSLPPRPQRFHHHVDHNRYGRRNHLSGLGSGYHATDKARYVHANYRFIVDPRGEYHAQSVDADMYLDWNTILQILASPQSQETACPICLGEPVAPRMAKCGHIFCLPCLIRYMHSEPSEPIPEKKARWKKCPICWDSVYISDTRPVRWYLGQEGIPPKEGADVVLRLVMRPAGSTLALPLERSHISKQEDEIPWHFAIDVMDYARVMKGSEQYMISSFDQEIEELRALEKHDELMFGEDTEWTSKAIRTVHEAKDKIKGIGGDPPLSSDSDNSRLQRPPIIYNTRQDAVPEMYILQHSVKSGQSHPPNFVTQHLSIAGSPDITAEGPHQNAAPANPTPFRMQPQATHTPSDYYFYQALLHYYLSPLDIRILKAAFGNYSNFPSTILPRVEHLSTGHVIDDDLRKRAKYLAHIPHGCEVSFLECDWTDTVPAEILDKFKLEIERRRKRNLDKEVREEKERARAEKDEDEMRYAAARRKRPSFSGHPDDFQALPPQDHPENFGSIDGTIESSPPMWANRRPNGSSFASLASPSTSPSTSRTVWGTAIVAPTSPVLQAVVQHNPADDGWLQGWENDLLHEDELIAQIEATSIAGQSSKSSAGPSKKKKGKKITLMSTNARRGA